MNRKYVLGLVWASALATSAFAQTGQQGAQAPRQTGQVAAQPKGYPASLYQMNDVSKSLNLTQQQISSLNKLTEQTQAQHRDNFNKISTLKEGERAGRLQELNRQYTNDWNKGAIDAFTQSQRARYLQLNYQYGGFNSLNEPEIQGRLNLTPGQMKDLGEQMEWSNKQMQEINRVGATDSTKATEMYRTYWQQREDRFNKFLTADQQRSWGEMIGEPYKFQPNFTPSR